MYDKSASIYVVKLLEEIDDICKKNNISYSLYGKTAVSAITKHTIEDDCARIIMHNDDFTKLCKAMSKERLYTRTFDSMYNNPEYMDYSARYCNSETTNISLDQKSNTFMSGIYVEILPIRNEETTKFQHFKLRFLEHGWEKHFCSFVNVESFKYLLPVPIVNIMKLTGKNKTSKNIFEKLSLAHSGKITSRCSIKGFNETLETFSYDPLAKTKNVEIDGKNFSISTRIDSILDKLFSYDWRNEIPKEEKDNIVLLDTSCKQFSRTLTRNKNIWKRYFRRKSRHMFIYKFSNKYDRQKKHIWSLAKRTGTRARLHFYYMPKMGVIRNLEKNKDYYRLSQIMRPNRIATLIAFKQGKGFAVNKELFDIQMMLFRFEGNDEIADKLEEITPEYYMNSIISLDSK